MKPRQLIAQDGFEFLRANEFNTWKQDHLPRGTAGSKNPVSFLGIEALLKGSRKQFLLFIKLQAMMNLTCLLRNNLAANFLPKQGST